MAGLLYLVVPTAPLALIAEPVYNDEGPLWYCITTGRYVGVHLNSALAQHAVFGVSGQAMKAYKTQSLAVARFNELLEMGMVKPVGL